MFSQAEGKFKAVFDLAHTVFGFYYVLMRSVVSYWCEPLKYKPPCPAYTKPSGWLIEIQSDGALNEQMETPDIHNKRSPVPDFSVVFLSPDAFCYRL